MEVNTQDAAKKGVTPITNVPVSVPTADEQSQAKPAKPPYKTESAADQNAAETLKLKVRDLFFLEGKPAKEIIKELIGAKENPSDKERDDIKNAVLKILRAEYMRGAPDGNGNRYATVGRSLHKMSGSGEEMKDVQLANFKVNTLKVILRDDGIQAQKFFKLEVECCLGAKRTITLSEEDFRQMNWHIGLFDGHAVIAPRMKEYVLVAIQYTAQKPAEAEIEYVHTGWQKFARNGKDTWLFLHADGAIGADGQHRDVKATLPDNLQRYSLPDPPSGDELKSAIRTSMKMADAAEPRVAFPIFAEVYRAPAGDCDFTGHFSGLTGSLKSALATVAQQHYGKDFDDRHLPANWSSTTNFNLERLHATKDVFTVLDDFVPRGTPTDQRRQHAEFDKIVRAVADGAFRGRLTDDHPPRGPRGMLHSTGEVTPNGESCRSRMFDIPVGPRSVDSTKLRELQIAGDRGTLAQSMSGFIQ